LLLGIGGIHRLAKCAEETCQNGKAARRRVIDRKAFQVLAVLLFLPPAAADQGEFLGFWLLVAPLLFIAVETCRAWRVPGFAPWLNGFVSSYLDMREDTSKADLVLTHLYLLLGCTIAVWLEASIATPSRPPAEEPLPAAAASWRCMRLAAGVLLVGVGDAQAVACGVSFGRRHWLLLHRTVEGSTAFVVSIFAAAVCI
jgi:dolichol kinase